MGGGASLPFGTSFGNGKLMLEYQSLSWCNKSKASGQHGEHEIKRYTKTVVVGEHFSTDTDVENTILFVFLQHVMLSTNVSKQMHA